ncbi:efflux RND transporter permease subunit [Pseudoalteromonas xiamenensis]|uniref:efflux RND transporter permease subunit n=1 Tax=Pseudoalteromonas xiamenensis TaxID=882626 RepID=UPI0027E5615E|nr:efflux RND transporter permease subunit [Pseudoalteromonas xiamenensis]WMN58887.1 efflux RND transporter permease subunit [Pseudoalteromonas xiamenensis]
MSMIEQAVRQSLSGKFPIFVFILSILLGTMALNFTPREEEPQIVVPMLDILVEAPNTEAPEVARLVTTPLEKLLMQIPGVEHVYSTTQTGGAVVTLRFYVGEDREKAILNTYAKLYANQHTMARVINNWQIRPIEVDDVPIVMLGLYSKDATRYSDFELTRFAQEISTQLQQIPDTSEIKVITGRTRQIQIYLDATALAAHQTTPLDVLMALQLSNQVQNVGTVVSGQTAFSVEAGDVLRNKRSIEKLVVNVINGQSIYLKDVARIEDGAAEPKNYQWLATTDSEQNLPMVTLSVAKQRGSNAVSVAEQSLVLMDKLQQSILPKEIGVKVLRNYGQTADEKVNDLTSSLAFAVFTVVVFVGVFLGWRPAIVVGLAVPICYGITLALDFAFGYSINRVTLFALILSLGLLVDDPITGIDNISRHLLRKGKSKDVSIVDAISEVKMPLIMSTLTIVMAFIPLAYITGMMGPYMAPMAFNVPVSVIVSTVVAFFVTPWLAKMLLNQSSLQDEVIDSKRIEQGSYARFITPLLDDKRKAKWVLWSVLGLFVASVSLPLFRAVPLKLLPFDNKNEVQILIDMPEGTSLEHTARMTKQVQQIVWQMSEVTAVAGYVGKPSSMDFNGMVRGYYRREASHFGELRVLLKDKLTRDHQSHGVVLRLRQALQSFGRDGVVIKVVEVPPGPPVLSTLVAEVYADAFISPEVHQEAAERLASRLAMEPHVVEVDTSIAAHAPLKRFVTDKEKAALSGIATQDINQTLAIASDGQVAGLMYVADEAEPLPIQLQLPYQNRNEWQNLLALQIRGRQDLVKQGDDFGLTSAKRPLVALSELGELKSLRVEPMIMRKDLREVIYVTAELNGRTPAEVIADVVADEIPTGEIIPEQNVSHWETRNYLQSGGGAYWQMPAGTQYMFGGEGEWRITVDVFRDMGIAFAFALTAIFVILRFQTASSSVSLIIMSAIPLTMIGIMPGFWLLNQFGEREIAGAPEPVLFTATAMIGMIALAGIVVRNSLILIDFINQAREQGASIRTALIQAGSVRMRPVLLTAGTTLLGNMVIILDPVFSGLALAIIFGIIASTLFSLVVVPLVYYLVFAEDTSPSQGETPCA